MIRLHIDSAENLPRDFYTTIADSTFGMDANFSPHLFSKLCWNEVYKMLYHSNSDTHLDLCCEYKWMIVQFSCENCGKCGTKQKKNHFHK